MGKWNNRRWMPRRKYYQEPPEPIHRAYYNESQSVGNWESNVPTWERQFCTLVGSVPWGKVVVAKKYMHCHDNVVKWNDSAGEAAFNNAKERFRAAVNGLPCDIALPDPDVYIDEIDWNPHIDTEMIMDLDREYFNPDEGRDNTMHNSVSIHAVGWHGNLNNGNNKWEDSELKGAGASNDAAQGWNKWGGSTDESKNLNNDKDLWEQSYTPDNGALNNEAWRSFGDKSWGWNQGQNCNQQSKFVDSPWGRDGQNVGPSKEKGWGSAVGNSWGSAVGNSWGSAVGNSWGREPWKTNVHESRNFNSVDAPCARTLRQGNGCGNNRGWGNCGDRNWGWKLSGNQNNEPKYLDSITNDRTWEALDGGCRKREGSHQYSSRYKSSRFQGDDYGTSQHWRNGRSQK